MENVSKIIIEYTGWISVDKKDLKVQQIDEENNLVDVDTTELTNKEISQKLNSGVFILASFGNTYLDNALDGEDDFNFIPEYERVDNTSVK